MEVRNNSCWSCCPNNDDNSVLLLLPGLLVRLLLPLCVVLRRLYYSPRTHFNIIIRHLTLIASLRRGAVKEEDGDEDETVVDV